MLTLGKLLKKETFPLLSMLQLTLSDFIYEISDKCKVMQL